MAKKNVADLLVDVLVGAGVERILRSFCCRNSRGTAVTGVPGFAPWERRHQVLLPFYAQQTQTTQSRRRKPICRK